MKKVDFPEVVEEGVALVGLIATYYDHLERSGNERLMPAGRRALEMHLDLMHKWHGYAEKTGDGDGLFSLFRTCRELINPVQSALQNLVSPKGAMITIKGARPENHSATTQAQLDVPPDRLLAAIIRVKESWAYIDAHPQIVFQRAS